MVRLGHGDPVASRRYQHATKDRDRAIAAGLDVIPLGLQKPDAR
jgi:hypothetical protein